MNMSNKSNNYFIDSSYKCLDKPVKNGFWTETRIANEPFNGGYAVMEYVSNLIDTTDKTILDIGCGISSKVKKFFPHAHLTGIDLQESIILARQNSPKELFYVCDLDSDSDISLISNQLPIFDIILCIDVIEHVLYPEKMLRLIKNKMNDDSIAFITTLERDISRGLESGKIGSPHPAHIREWNQAEFTSFIKSEGFNIIDVILTPLSPKKDSQMRNQTLVCKLQNMS